jgi:hypothetical protein
MLQAVEVTSPDPDPHRGDYFDAPHPSAEMANQCSAANRTLGQA